MIPVGFRERYKRDRPKNLLRTFRWLGMTDEEIKQWLTTHASDTDRQKSAKPAIPPRKP